MKPEFSPEDVQQAYNMLTSTNRHLAPTSFQSLCSLQPETIFLRGPDVGPGLLFFWKVMDGDGPHGP